MSLMAQDAESISSSPICLPMGSISQQETRPSTVLEMGDSTHTGPRSPTSECLFNLADDHRFNDRGKVYCYEISTCAQDKKQSVELLYSIILSEDQDHTLFANQLRRFWKAEDAACHSRLVVVEDISGPLIGLLRRSVELDPLLFIQHLKGSGVNCDSLSPLVGSQCPDTFLDTHIISAQWYRPVSRLLKEQRKKTGFSLLLDPSPTGDSGSEPGSREGRLEKFPRRESDMEKETNIFRNAWEIGPIATTDDQVSTIPTAWEEKVTVYRESRRGVEFVIVLTDPLPTLSGGADLVARNLNSGERRATGLGSHIPSSIPGPKTSKKDPVMPYTQMAPRWTYQRGRLRQQSAPQGYWDETRTAHMDMMSWMTNQCLRDPESLSKNPCHLAMVNPAEALFRIMFLDTMMLSDVFDNTLQQIRRASLEDSELQVLISEWRRMLLEAQLRLPTLRTSISDFIRHASGRPLPPKSTTKVSHDFRLLASRVRQRISAVIKLAEEVDVALRAELSILESRKQLLESSSVTRLTELAFVFVPLSFVASTFSMQVQELQSPPPLTTFILAASSTVLLAYVVRLFLNSRVFGKISRKTEQAARRYSQVPDSQPVPTRAYMNIGIWCILSYSASVYGVVFTCLCAVVWLWAGRGQADGGLKAVLTVVLATTLPLLAAVPFTNQTVPQWLKKGLPRQQKTRQPSDSSPRKELTHA
ncbi:hypothetical protein B0T25DRAFT_174282 [Lasiosphaeria hispida]|uniref:Uncharacterized protein n=1 Tax=Lasiosphaeria hispida TaxID=260671 RepID=A0AAJ0HNN4_9PEZI|nr:hypothetical protein B0T25DRAFT_174282 [Lasiosphaeria hispida]